MSCAAPRTSVACNPPSIHTTALAVCDSSRASASLMSFASANRRAFVLCCSRFAWFAGDVMMAMR